MGVPFSIYQMFFTGGCLKAETLAQNFDNNSRKSLRI